MLWITLDPNVYLAAQLEHPPSLGLLDDLLEQREYVRFVLDEKDGTILEAYENIIEYLDGKSRERLGWLLANQQTMTKHLPISRDCLEDEFLHQVGCDTPVEPHLLALCMQRGRDVHILAVGQDMDHPLWRHRGIHDAAKVKKLKEYFGLVLSVWCGQRARRALTDALRYQPLYPHNETELEEFLSDKRFAEGDTLEFKQPHNEQEGGPFYLTPSILKETMQAICALSNAYGGKVLLGVAENKRHIGWIKGFTLEYKPERESKPRPKNWDELFTMLTTNPNLLRKFSPPFEPSELRYEEVELQNGRWVLVFDIAEPNRDKVRERYYGTGMYVRRGAETKLEKLRRK